MSVAKNATRMLRLRIGKPKGDSMRGRQSAIKRVEIAPGVVMIHGDCLSVLPTIGSVDHCIFDPPYESHMHRAKSKASTSRKKIRTDGSTELLALDFDSIEPIRAAVAQHVTRVSQGWSLLFCTPEGVAPWRDAIEDSGARYKRACAWIKLGAAPQFNGQGPAMGVEMIVASWCGTGVSKWNGGGHVGVWSHHCNPKGRTRKHPAEKPLALMTQLVNLFTMPGQTVLDPFAGIASTGVACIQEGRSFIGIEKNKAYFDFACERLRAAVETRDALNGAELLGGRILEAAV